MTPLQSNKAAPNKNNNKKKINSPHITKKKSSISHIVWYIFVGKILYGKFI